MVIFTVCSCFLWGYFGSILYDCGREAYLPKLILEGKVLFKDIFGMYNPLSYQINALLYFVFGIHTNVLYFAGTVNAFLTLFCIYLISRQFFNYKYSASFVLFVMLGIFFNSRLCLNYIFPYSYAMIYAVSFMLYSAFLGLLYIKNKKSVYLVLSFFLLGISFANKPEFCLCAIALAGLLIYGRERYKVWILSTLAFLLPTIISYTILFLQGFSFENLIDYINFIHNLLNTQEQQFYNLQLSGVNAVFRTFFYFCLFTLFFIIVPKLFAELIKRSKAYIILLIILVILFFNNYAQLVMFPAICVSWAGIACFFILYKAIKNKNIELIYLSIFAILSCSRFNFVLAYGYFCYFGLLPVSVCLIYMFRYMNTKFFDIYTKKAVVISLIIFAVTAYTLNFTDKHKTYTKIDSNDKQSILYEQQKYAVPFNDTIEWIIKNTNSNDTVLVLPEGLFVNYITKRSTNPKYYHLIPNHISALGEDNIVKDLSQNLPDYIVLSNTSYSLYGAEYMCKDFGLKICEMINRNYDLKQVYGIYQILKLKKQ